MGNDISGNIWNCPPHYKSGILYDQRSLRIGNEILGNVHGCGYNPTFLAISESRSFETPHHQLPVPNGQSAPTGGWGVLLCRGADPGPGDPELQHYVAPIQAGDDRCDSFERLVFSPIKNTQQTTPTKQVWEKMHT